MKNLLFLLILFFHFKTFSEEIKIISKIQSVIVFRNGAQVKRIANVNLKSGINELVITDLPDGLIESSINVKIDPKIEMSSVSFRRNFENNPEVKPEYIAIKKKYDEAIAKKENEQIVFDTWKEEENLILTNKKIAGENTSLSSDQLIKIADLYRTRLFEIKQKLLTSNRNLKEIDKELAKISSQLNEIGNKPNHQFSGEIVLYLKSQITSTEKLELSYLDSRANWTTSFDLRLESLQKPLNLVNKGLITQNTGEDWTDISLTLSTGNPQSNVQFPILNPWFLYYYQDFYSLQKTKQSNELPAQARMDENIRSFDVVIAGSSMVTATENITFMEFSLPDKMTIPSDNKTHEVKLKDNEIPAQFEYIAIPKLDKNVYLRANILNWDQYNLSSGQVKLYFEGTFTGTSYIDANLTSDTLSISLGPDIAIAAKRDKLKDLKKSSIFSGKKNQQFGYEINIKNNKPDAIDIVLIDQIPLSTDAEMLVEADELSGGKLNNETGLIEWKIKIKPGEQIKKRLSYTIKIPKEKIINL
jgi:uncharacterized protein (TIGR02231 family)